MVATDLFSGGGGDQGGHKVWERPAGERYITSMDVSVGQAGPWNRPGLHSARDQLLLGNPGTIRSNKTCLPARNNTWLRNQFSSADLPEGTLCILPACPPTPN